MSMPCGNWIFRIRIETIFSVNRPSNRCERKMAARIIFSYHIACESPMLDGGDHISTDAKIGDSFLIGEGAFGQVTISISHIHGLFKPHLAEREGFMPGEMGICFANRNRRH